MIQVTVEGGLMRERELHPSLKILKDWEAQGKIEIFEADRARASEINTLNPGWPGGPKPQIPARRQRTLSKKSTGGISFQEISNVLFPSRDSTKLNMTEVNCVAHLLRHHTAGRAFFITTNSKDFISDGKQARLLAAYKITVLTPDEAVFVIENYEKQQKAPAAAEAPAPKKKK